MTKLSELLQEILNHLKHEFIKNFQVPATINRERFYINTKAKSI